MISPDNEWSYCVLDEMKLVRKLVEDFKVEEINST
jgi:hypothetical protein